MKGYCGESLIDGVLLGNFGMQGQSGEGSTTSAGAVVGVAGARVTQPEH
jgi:hypothetical protein